MPGAGAPNEKIEHMRKIPWNHEDDVNPWKENEINLNVLKPIMYKGNKCNKWM